MINDGFLPVYIPGMEHQVFVQRVPTMTSFETPSTFLVSGQSEEFAFDFVVPANGLVKIAINVILDGGELQIAIDSSVSLDPFSRTPRSAFVGSTRISGTSWIASRKEGTARSAHPVS